MTFDQLWEQEERAGLQQRLLQTYPEWKRNRRIRNAVLSAFAVLVVAVVPIYNYQFSVSKSYDMVVSNRTTFTDSHWADIAANILTKETV